MLSEKNKRNGRQRETDGGSELLKDPMLLLQQLSMELRLEFRGLQKSFCMSLKKLPSENVFSQTQYDQEPNSVPLGRGSQQVPVVLVGLETSKHLHC